MNATSYTLLSSDIVPQVQWPHRSRDVLLSSYSSYICWRIVRIIMIVLLIKGQLSLDFSVLFCEKMLTIFFCRVCLPEHLSSQALTGVLIWHWTLYQLMDVCVSAVKKKRKNNWGIGSLNVGTTTGLNTATVFKGTIHAVGQMVCSSLMSTEKKWTTQTILMPLVMYNYSFNLWRWRW